VIIQLKQHAKMLAVTGVMGNAKIHHVMVNVKATPLNLIAKPLPVFGTKNISGKNQAVMVKNKI